MTENTLVVHCPTAAQREALRATCCALKAGWGGDHKSRPGVLDSYTEHLHLDPVGLTHGSQGFYRERGYTITEYTDVTLAQLRTALGLDEPEPEPVELPGLGDWECRIDGEDLVVGCQEVDAFVAAYQAARGRQAGGTEEEPAQAQEVRLSNGLRLRLEASEDGNTAHLRARREGGHMHYLLKLDTMPTRAARLIGACYPLSDLLPIGAQGRLIVE